MILDKLNKPTCLSFTGLSIYSLREQPTDETP
jgi:hypothetical protein